MRQKRVLLSKGILRWSVRVINAYGETVFVQRYFKQYKAELAAVNYATFYGVKTEVS